MKKCKFVKGLSLCLSTVLVLSSLNVSAFDCKKLSKRGAGIVVAGSAITIGSLILWRNLKNHKDLRHGTEDVGIEEKNKDVLQGNGNEFVPDGKQEEKKEEEALVNLEPKEEPDGKNQAGNRAENQAENQVENQAGNQAGNQAENQAVGKKLEQKPVIMPKLYQNKNNNKAKPIGFLEPEIKVDPMYRNCYAHRVSYIDFVEPDEKIRAAYPKAEEKHIEDDESNVNPEAESERYKFEQGNQYPEIESGPTIYINPKTTRNRYMIGPFPIQKQ